MSQQLTLELSDEVYADLQQKANAVGLSIVEWIVAALSNQNNGVSRVLHWVDEQLHREAMQLLIERQDKTYSLCDAVSFVLMRQCGITEALTTDRHFEQESFVKLLQSAP